MLTYLDGQIELHLGDARDVVPKLGRRFPVACFDAPDAVIVDRMSKWRNLFKMVADLPGMLGQPMDAAGVRRCFEFFTIQEPPAHELVGKDLACWCALDAPCHADGLLKYAAYCIADKGVTC